MHKGTVCFTPEGNPPDTDGRTYIYLYISAGHMNVESEVADILRYIKDGTTGNNQYIRKLEEDADYVPDYWYVLKTKDAYGNDIAREALDGQTFEFVNGFIKLSKTEITNKHANCIPSFIM
jgi:hypothetical protein